MGANHQASGYGYREQIKQRDRNTRRLPAVCPSCGKIIPPSAVYGVDWENGHDDRRGGVRGDPRHSVPQHVKCNRSDGGKQGAALTNAAVKTRKRQRSWT